MSLTKQEKAILQKLGSRGGRATVEKYGKLHMSNIQKLRWERHKKAQKQAKKQQKEEKIVIGT